MFDTYGADALRWYLMSSPILRGGDLVVTEQGDPRRRPPGAAAAVERLVVLHALRQRRRRTRRRWRTDSTQVLDRYVLAKLHDLVSRPDGTARRLRPLRGVRGGAAVSSTRSPTGTSAAAGPVLGLRPRRLRHAVHRPARAHPGRRAAAADRDRGALPRAHRRAQRAPHRLAGRRRAARRPRPGGRDGRRPRRRARRRCRCARRTGCGCASRWRRSPSPAPTPQSLAPFADLIADEVNVKEVRLTADVDALCTRVLELVPRVLGPRLGRDTQRVIGAVRAGDWSRDRRRGHGGRRRAAEGRVHPAPGAVRPRQAAAALPGHAGVVAARHRGHPRPRRRGRGPRRGPGGAGSPPRRPGST